MISLRDPIRHRVHFVRIGLRAIWETAAAFLIVVSTDTGGLCDEPARKVATVNEQRIGHLLVLALDRNGIVGNQRQALRLLRLVQAETWCARLGNLPPAIDEEAKGQGAWFSRVCWVAGVCTSVVFAVLQRVRIGK